MAKKSFLSQWVFLWVFVQVPGLPIAMRWGWAGAALYTAISLLLTVFVGPVFWRWLNNLGSKLQQLVATTVLVCSVLVIIAMTPHKARIVSDGSDRNEAVTWGAQALLRGSNPYNVKTSRDMPISQLPGELLSALPAVSISRNAAWMTAFWWISWVLFGRSLVPPEKRSLVTVGLAFLGTSLMVPYQVYLGEDLLWTGLQAAIAVGVFVSVVPTGKSSRWKKLAATIFLAVSLASRVSWVVTFASLALIFGATSWTLLAVAIWLALILPFWFLSPVFGPLSNPMGGAIPVLVRAVIVVSLFAVAVGLRLRHEDQSPARLLKEIAIVQGSLVLATTLVASFAFSRFSYGTLGYGAMAQGCGVMAATLLLAVPRSAIKT